MLAYLLALPATVAAMTMDDISFDAIFYRARPAFNYCYAFEGTVGYTLRPIPDSLHISHYGDSCPAVEPDGPLAFTATACGGQCQADCTSLVRKSWNANETSLLLSTRDIPGPCSGPDGTSGAERVLDMGLVLSNEEEDLDALANEFAALRPGDGCENTHHSVLLVRNVEGDTWTTWEANSASGGIGQFSRTLPDTLSETWGDVCGYGLAGNGCWHPPMVRTGPPSIQAPADGELFAEPEDVRFRFQRPTAFPALADFLLWVWWREAELAGGTETWHHRIVRIPAFTKRFNPVDHRLAEFPNLGPEHACPGRPDETCPTDVVLSNVIEVSGERLLAADAYRPHRFVDPDGGEVTTTWRPGLVPCVGTSPSSRPSEEGCTFAADTLELRPGVTYNWSVRVERIGEDRGGFRRAPLIGTCVLDDNGFETDPVCKDPQWATPRTFIAGTTMVRLAWRGSDSEELYPRGSDPDWVYATCGSGNVLLHLDDGSEIVSGPLADRSLPDDDNCELRPLYFIGTEFEQPLGSHLRLEINRAGSEPLPGYEHHIGESWLHWFNDEEIPCPGSPDRDARCFSLHESAQLTAAGQRMGRSLIVDVTLR